MKNIPVFILLWAGLVLPAPAMAKEFYRLVDIYSCADNKTSYQGIAMCATFGPKNSQWAGHATRFPLFFLTEAACREWATEYINRHTARRSHYDGSEWAASIVRPNCVPHRPVYAPKGSYVLTAILACRDQWSNQCSDYHRSHVWAAPRGFPSASACQKWAEARVKWSVDRYNRRTGKSVIRTVVKARCVLIP
ncbi:MAG: hypothetical protein OYG32_02615 [Rhodospirillaceae bacterium]|nr:hypothetical protein [Rhodospirillaceae bacterium]